MTNQQFLDAENAMFWHQTKMQHIDAYNAICAKHSTALPAKFQGKELKQKHREILHKIRYDFIFYLINTQKISFETKEKLNNLFSVFTEKFYKLQNK